MVRRVSGLAPHTRGRVVRPAEAATGPSGDEKLVGETGCESTFPTARKALKTAGEHAPKWACEPSCVTPSAKVQELVFDGESFRQAEGEFRLPEGLGRELSKVFQGNACSSKAMSMSKESLQAALAVIEEARNRLGKPKRTRVLARTLVRENKSVITGLREIGESQEAAVLYLLQISDDAHKADTLRKAIRAEVGEWQATQTVPVREPSPRSERGEAPPQLEAEPSNSEGGLVL